MQVVVPVLVLEGQRRPVAGGISSRMDGVSRTSGMRAVRVLVSQLPSRARILRTGSWAFRSVEAVRLLGARWVD